MSDWQKFSRLPDSPEYWEGVTRRVRGSLDTIYMDTAPAEPVRSLVPLAWTAIAATLIAVIAARALPPESVNPAAIISGLAPADSTGTTWLEQSRPPSVVELLMTQMGGPR